ncbi:MAG: DUF308 domain-containing protein [Gammaproteobacteria bacterium]|nr:DUF308 domain-containing protein [Gammaproteobacteria bacterium]
MSSTITALAVLFYTALWVIASGVPEIVAAVRLREFISNEWLLTIAGLVSVALGFGSSRNPSEERARCCG